MDQVTSSLNKMAEDTVPQKLRGVVGYSFKQYVKHNLFIRDQNENMSPLGTILGKFRPLFKCIHQKRRKRIYDFMAPPSFESRGCMPSTSLVFPQQDATQMIASFLDKRFPDSPVKSSHGLLAASRVGSPNPNASLCTFLCGSPQPGGIHSFQLPSISFAFHYLQMRKKPKLTNKEGPFHLITFGCLHNFEMCAPGPRR